MSDESEVASVAYSALGEIVTMKDGSQWLHPWTGAAPRKLREKDDGSD